MRFNITDNVVVRALSKICDMVCLNILWLICCIPIFTIGASTTALYAVMLKLVKNEEGYIFRSFFGAFRDNFKKSTIIWLILALLGFMCIVDLRVAGMLEGALSIAMRSLFIAVGFVIVSVMTYSFALTARYENNIRATFRNALILTLGKLPYTLLMFIISAVLIVASVWNTVTLMFALPLWFLIGGSLIAWINSYVLRRVFAVFDNEDNETEKEG